MAWSREALLEYLETKLGVDPTTIDDDTALFSSNILDSFSMVDLIMFIETSAGVQVSPTDVTLDNLDSVAKILRYVDERMSAVG